MPAEVTQIAVICTAVSTAIFAGIAICNQIRKLRLKLKRFVKQPPPLGGGETKMEYFAVVQKKGSGVPVGCYATLIFKEKQYHGPLHEILADYIDTSSYEEEGRVSGFAALLLFAESDRGISIYGDDIVVERRGRRGCTQNYQVEKHQKIKFIVSSDNTPDLSKKVSFAEIIRKAKDIKTAQ